MDPTTNNANTYLINGTRKILVDPGHYDLFPVVRENLNQVVEVPCAVHLVAYPWYKRINITNLWTLL